MAAESQSGCADGFCREGGEGGGVCCSGIVVAKGQSGGAVNFCREGWAGDEVLHGGGQDQERLRRRFLPSEVGG